MQQRGNQGKVFSGTVIRTIESKMQQLYVLTNQAKQGLCNGLSSKGEVCLCQTEADLHSAKSKKHGSLPRVVVSRPPEGGGHKSQDGDQDLFETQAEFDEEFEPDEAFIGDEDADDSDTEMASATHSHSSEGDTSGRPDAEKGDEESPEMEWQPEADVAEGSSSGRKRRLEPSSPTHKRPRTAHPHGGIN
ncbi:hypothetical protein EC968_007713 [Mortierella alpina]|nr:hypothetical protein EC968_007713 [Mortierella alpina]